MNCPASHATGELGSLGDAHSYSTFTQEISMHSPRRHPISAIIMFLAVVALMGLPIGLVVDHKPSLAAYGSGVVALASWLAVVTYRNEAGDPPTKPPVA